MLSSALLNIQNEKLINPYIPKGMWHTKIENYKILLLFNNCINPKENNKMKYFITSITSRFNKIFDVNLYVFICFNINCENKQLTIEQLHFFVTESHPMTTNP
jgi:hypothetical protein